MKAVIESDRFAAELGGWALRGTLCAASSFWWAFATGFNAPVEIAGMATGVIAWVALFATFSVWHGQAPHRGPSRLVSALKIAAWIKFLLSAVGWAAFALCSLLKNENLIVDAGFLFVMPDCLLGMASIALVSFVAGTDQLPNLDSFGWTALTTFVDGAFFLMVIGALALAVLLWWRCAPGVLTKLKLSPTRCAG